MSVDKATPSKKQQLETQAMQMQTFAEKNKKRRSQSLGPDDRFLVEKLEDMPQQQNDL